jgi:hypothetical protein
MPGFFRLLALPTALAATTLSFLDVQAHSLARSCSHALNRIAARHEASPHQIRVPQRICGAGLARLVTAYRPRSLHIHCDRRVTTDELALISATHAHSLLSLHVALTLESALPLSSVAAITRLTALNALDLCRNDDDYLGPCESNISPMADPVDPMAPPIDLSGMTALRHLRIAPFDMRHVAYLPRSITSLVIGAAIHWPRHHDTGADAADTCSADRVLADLTNRLSAVASFEHLAIRTFTHTNNWHILRALGATHSPHSI